MALSGRMTVESAEGLLGSMSDLSESELRCLLSSRAARGIGREYVTARCLTALWDFLWFGPYRKARRHYLRDVHEPLCLFLQDWTRVDGYGHVVRVPEKVLTAFRGFNKSQGGILWAAWQVGRNPDVRGFYRSHKDPEATKSSRQVRDMLTSEDYVRVFPWVRPAMSGTRMLKWAEDGFFVEREDMAVKTPTLEASGRETSVTGNHYHFRIYDDWEYESDRSSVAAQQEIIEKHRLDEALMLPGSMCLNIGTPYVHKLYIDAALKRTGYYEDRDYDLFVMPAELKVFERPWMMHEPVLGGDRQTLRCEGAGFPVVEANLERCQAKVSFFSPLVNDVIVEVREVVWNDGDHFRVNRAFPEVLGQPLRAEVSATKVACPIKHTYDAQDVDTEYEGAYIIRESLPAKRRKFGPDWYASQMLLNPLNPEAAVWDRSQIKVVTADELPAEGVRYWYRAIDLASSRKTACRTAISTAFWHERGLFIVHGIAKNIRKVDILFELFCGVRRVRDMGGALRWTSTELQGREEMLGEDIELAARDPLKYFTICGEPWASRAKEMFTDASGVPLNLRMPTLSITRPPSVRKSQRIMGALDAHICAGDIHILDTTPYLDDFLDELDTFTLEGGDKGFDILDTLADIAREGSRPRPPVKADDRRYDFVRSQREAILRGHTLEAYAHEADWR